MQQNRRDFLTASAAATLASTGPAFAQANIPQIAPAQKSAGAYQAPSEVKKITIINLRALEAEAQQVLSPGAFASISGGAGDEWTKAENQDAFKRFPIHPRHLTGNGMPDISTTLLGTNSPSRMSA